MALPSTPRTRRVIEFQFDEITFFLLCFRDFVRLHLFERENIFGMRNLSLRIASGLIDRGAADHHHLPESGPRLFAL